ncbi:MAG: universal stress protein [Phycisphaerales bacterium]
MVKRFLIAYDGSTLAREAFAYAAMLAKKLGAEVHAVHVLEPSVDAALLADPTIMTDPMMPPVVLSPADLPDAEQERADAENLLRELGDMCQQMGVTYTHRVERGMLLDTMMAASRPTDVLALGLKGRFRRAGVGSTTRSLVTSAPCPVLVVSGPLSPINRVLTPYDGTIPSTRATIFARNLAKQAGWPLSILAVPRDDLSLEEAIDWSQQLAKDAQVMTLSRSLGSEAELIERTAGADPYALLVMGAYADSWFKDLFAAGGGTTSHVLSHLKAPVILVPKQAKTEE